MRNFFDDILKGIILVGFVSFDIFDINFVWDGDMIMVSWGVLCGVLLGGMVSGIVDLV